MTLYALQDIDDAIAATRSFLWPFDFGRWLKLAFVVFFLGGTGSANPAQFGNTTSSTTPSDPGQLPSLSEIVNSLTPTEWAIIGAIVGAIILIGVGFAFVGAVMEFVFVESIRRERVSIRSYWGERWRQGGRLLGFRLVVGLLSLVVAGGAIAAAAWPLLTGNGSFSVVLLLLAIGVAFVVAIVSSLVNGFTTQFVVPVMIAENRTVLAAWRRFWPTLTSQWKQYLVYVFVRFVLSIAVGLVVGIVTFVGMLVLAIPFVIVGVGGVALLSVSEIAGGALIAITIALFILLLFVLALLLSVPVQTFLRYYALLVLGDTEAAFDLVDEQRQAIRA
jgi:MFS family permease